MTLAASGGAKNGMTKLALEKIKDEPDNNRQRYDSSEPTADPSGPHFNRIRSVDIFSRKMSRSSRQASLHNGCSRFTLHPFQYTMSLSLLTRYMLLLTSPVRMPLIGHLIPACHGPNYLWPDMVGSLC